MVKSFGDSASVGDSGDLGGSGIESEVENVGGVGVTYLLEAIVRGVIDNMSIMIL